MQPNGTVPPSTAQWPYPLLRHVQYVGLERQACHPWTNNNMQQYRTTFMQAFRLGSGAEPWLFTEFSESHVTADRAVIRLTTWTGKSVTSDGALTDTSVGEPHHTVRGLLKQFHMYEIRICNLSIDRSSPSSRSH
jgi:hypothetical protein